MSESDTERAGSEYLYEALVDAGVELLVGLPGTQTLPLDRTVVQREEMRYLMARHETAIPHIAWGHYETSGNVAATITVPGPGDTNAMHGLKNALDDCVPILHVSPDINPIHRGQSPIHEIDPDTYDNVVKRNLTIERPVEFLEKINEGIDIALTPPYGPVRFGVSSSLLDDRFYTPDIKPGNHSRGSNAHDDQYSKAAALLSESERPVLYIGGGARRSDGSSTAIKELVETLNLPVLSSYKGKGVFPEDNDRFLGVTGSHLPASAKRVLDAADVVLALGSDFDGVTTDNWSLPFGDKLVHVNIDTADINNGYEADVVLIDDVVVAVEKLIDSMSGRTNNPRWDGREVASRARHEYSSQLEDQGLYDDTTPLKTPAVLETLRSVLPRESVVTTDVGGFRLWMKQVFEVYEDTTYVTAGSWAGMGVGLPAAIGAKAATPDRPVVAITGDGGFMMCAQEIHTAVCNGLEIIVIVLNNADYGVISKSLGDRYEEDYRFDWPSPNFDEIAQGFGCHGECVQTLTSMKDAVEAALSREGQVSLIEVSVDSEEPKAATAANFESTLDFER